MIAVRSRPRLLALALVWVLAAGCSSGGDVTTRSEDVQPAADPAPPDPATAPPPAASTGPADASGSGGGFTITFLGDSLTAGIGLRTDDAYPTLIQKRFTMQGYRVEVINAGVIGQTTSDGVRQLAEVLQPETRILVVALGANDALRGISLDQTRDNLKTIIDAARSSNVGVLLAGMDPPTNLGVDYQSAFRGIFIRLGSEYKESIVYMPSLLEGVAGIPTLNQDGGVRPNAEGAAVIAQNMYSRLQVMVDGMGGGS